MANNMNRVTLIGRLGKDPDIRNLNNGSLVCNLSVATSESWKDRSGQKQEKTEWHRVTVWGDGLIDKFIRPYVVKGDLVLVEGKLETRKWQDQSGNDRYTTEIVVGRFGSDFKLLASKSDNRGQRTSNGGGGGYSDDDDGGMYGGGGDFDSGPGDLDDEIPF